MTVPEWFRRNVADAPKRGVLDVEAAKIETLAWGRRGDRGMMLIHGNGAHADWWSHLGPFFSSSLRVGAISLSGSGRSSWREAYSFAQHGREIVAGAAEIGLFDASEKPWLIAHSMGARSAAEVAASPDGARFEGVILVDSGVRPPSYPTKHAREHTGKHSGFNSLEEGMARFRLRPEQPDVPQWMMDHIGRRSLVLRADGSWNWCFDPKLTNSLWNEIPFYADRIKKARCPLVFIWGSKSALITPEIIEFSMEVAAEGTKFVELAEAHHHLILDQPLAFVAALRAVIA